jgi:hypothetical protein
MIISVRTSPKPDSRGYFEIWADGALIGWADAVVLGQPLSALPIEAQLGIASAEIEIPIRFWPYDGRLRAYGFARLLYGYKSRNGLLPPPEMLPGVHYLTEREDMTKHGWTEVTAFRYKNAPKHSAFLTHDIGSWAIGERRLA